VKKLGDELGVALFERRQDRGRGHPAEASAWSSRRAACSMSGGAEAHRQQAQTRCAGRAHWRDLTPSDPTFSAPVPLLHASAPRMPLIIEEITRRGCASAGAGRNSMRCWSVCRSKEPGVVHAAALR